MASKPDLHRFDDLFAPFGRIELRRMFGGEGIYVNGSIIGIIIRDLIYLKTDDATRGAYLAEGCKPFSYEAQGKTRESVTYYAIPDRLYDDPEELAVWARRAQAAIPIKPKKVAKPKKAAKPKPGPKKKK
jgi:DNA transformation protein